MALMPRANHRPEHDAQRQARGGNRQHQLEVVHADLQRRVAESLERADLLTLRGHQPGHHDIQQESRHAEEDHREDRRHGLQAAQLLGDEAVAELVLAAMAPRPP
jgi:hypothetical protein